jgi:hypothetical protein
MSLNSWGLPRCRLHFRKRSWPSTRQLRRLVSDTRLRVQRALMLPSHPRSAVRTRVSLIVLVVRSRTKQDHLILRKEKLPHSVLIRIQNLVDRLDKVLRISGPSSYWVKVSKQNFTQPTRVLPIK